MQWGTYMALARKYDELAVDLLGLEDVESHHGVADETPKVLGAVDNQVGCGPVLGMLQRTPSLETFWIIPRRATEFVVHKV